MAPSFDIVFAVCHPDDEALWVGGLLHELSRFDFLKVHVVCLSGRDPTSPRMAEFEAARAAAGYASGIILGKPLRDANLPLPPLATILEEGMAALSIVNPALVITHSPFGDEHRNPHHRQAFGELLAWSRASGTPFGFFSCAAIPSYRHVPILEALRRRGTLQLTNMFRCTGRLPFWRKVDPGLKNYCRAPRWLLQFQVDGAAKARVLAAYESIGLAEHRDGYAFFTSALEQLYLFGALPPAIRALLDAMPAPTAGSLFAQPSFLSRVLHKLGIA
jgi:LmbE family N-acetylglucosaminyl deacetylase